MNRPKSDLVWSILLTLVVDFAILAAGAYDLWSATVVHVAVLLLSVGVLLTKCWGKNSKGLFLPLAPLSALVCVCFYISFKGSVNPSESFLALMDWITAFQMFYIACNIFTSEKAVQIFVVGVAPLFILQLPLLIYQNNFFLLRRGYQDPAGTLVNANVFTVFQLMWVAPVWDRLKKSFLLQSKLFWVWGLVLVVMLVNFLFARSILGWVLLLMFLPTFIGWQRLKIFSKAHPKFLWVCGIVVLMVMAVLLIIKIRLIFQTGVDFYNRPYTSRVIWWKSGILMLKAHPWFGIGLGNFSSAYLAFKTGEGMHSLHSHSNVIKFLSETGLIGFLSILSFFLGWARRIYASKNALSYRAPFLAGIILFLLFTAVSIGIEFLSMLAVLAIFMGMLITEEHKVSFKLKKSVQIIIVAAVLSFLPNMILPFLASQQVVQGESLFIKGNLQESLALFESSTQTDPRAFEPYRNWAAALYKRFQTTHDSRDVEEAIHKQKEAIDRNKLSGELWFELSRYLEAGGKIQESMMAAQAAIAYNKTNDKFKENLERLLHKPAPSANPPPLDPTLED